MSTRYFAYDDYVSPKRTSAFDFAGGSSACGSNSSNNSKQSILANTTFNNNHSSPQHNQLLHKQLPSQFNSATSQHLHFNQPIHNNNTNQYLPHDQHQISTATSSDSDSECSTNNNMNGNNACGQNSQNSVNSNRYKTELCRNFSITGNCNYGKKCQYAHGKDELNLKPERKTNQYYKTRPCNEFYKYLFCPYGQRCKYSHTLPQSSDLVRQAATFFQKKLLQLESESISIQRLPIFMQPQFNTTQAAVTSSNTTIRSFNNEPTNTNSFATQSIV